MPSKNPYTLKVITYAPSNNEHIRRVYAETWWDAYIIAAREAYPFGWEKIIFELRGGGSVTFSYEVVENG